MPIWDTYPSNYRSKEVQAILAATRAGECVSLVGLSGSGKSNLLGYLANRQSELVPPNGRIISYPEFILIDCNRLPSNDPDALYHLILDSTCGRAVSEPQSVFNAIEVATREHLKTSTSLCLLFDRFDTLTSEDQAQTVPIAFSNLRALRDAHKYLLTYVVTTRHTLNPYTELAELFYGNTLFLGTLSTSDAQWSIIRYADRKGLVWDEKSVNKIIRVSGGYPSLLRAVCEAYSSGTRLDLNYLAEHPVIIRRINEFWADQPNEEEITSSRLEEIPLLMTGRPTFLIDPGRLTAKEHLLWKYLTSHPNAVCEKDALIRAVWPEDQIYERGIRDDSLAQLIRRLREKVESDPSNPRHIQTVPGRGYRFVPK